MRRFPISIDVSAMSSPRRRKIKNIYAEKSIRKADQINGKTIRSSKLWRMGGGRRMRQAVGMGVANGNHRRMRPFGLKPFGRPGSHSATTVLHSSSPSFRGSLTISKVMGAKDGPRGRGGTFVASIWLKNEVIWLSFERVKVERR
ncbi:hypothetical protein E3N88_15180 [Mikania micrantha]|uniref:Uncharacterized protein n=1 Tax=Mikania micrantha TaxID=192012 RepID=A0A5N6NUP4_9ASTR|nr:hypothetical protein E3N88_15180 [Mikania micrantha]